MATISYRILKFEPLKTDSDILDILYCYYFWQDQFLCLNQFFRHTALIRPNLYQFQKDCHQDNLSFACLQFHKHNCLNILADNIYFLGQVKNQYK